MTIALATAWQPRGELARFINLLPHLQNAYSGIAVSLPPGADEKVVEHLQELSAVKTIITQEWPWGRYLALQGAFEMDCTHIQYADFDRLLRWIETRPQEWQQTLETVQQHDCLIIGRTTASYQTHPQALIQTEAISNLVVSFLVGQVMDVSAGSKGFSRQAAEFILAHCEPGHALGTDAEWPLVLKRAGFQVSYVTVDGLDWESADRFQKTSADQHSQKQAAEDYDSDPENWARRVGVAMEIVQLGINTVGREINPRKR